MEVTDAVEQDQIADSLMGEPAESTEAAQDTGIENSGDEVETQSVDDGETVEGQEEEADDWLPTEQEKVFPDATLQRYAKRYGYTDEEYAALDPRAKQLLHDKINSDIYLQQQQMRQESQEETEQKVQQPEPTQPQLTTQQWMENVARTADQITNPEIATMFASQFLSAFGVKEAPTPQVAMALTKTMTTFGLNLLNTVLPQMLNAPVSESKSFFQDLVEKNYEGFGDSYQTQQYATAWDKVVKSNPAFSKLPGFSDSGSEQLRMEAAEKIAGSVEDFNALTFKDANGKALTPYQTAQKKYTMLARVMAGGGLTPQQTKAVFEAGNKAARRQQVNREAGNLGSGKSNQFASNTADSDFWSEGVAEYQKQHGGL